jgi:GntR family transcriptional regulator
MNLIPYLPGKIIVLPAASAVRPAGPVPAEPGRSRYASLAAALRERVLAGEWPPGSAMPAEQTLATEHRVALGTMRRALEWLVNEGLIERIHGRGTFVRSGLAGAPMLRFFRFGGAGSGVPQSLIRARQVLPAPAEVARRMGMGRGEASLRLQRVRSMEGQPCLVEDIWLRLPLMQALVTDDMSEWGDLLYPMLARRCSVYVHRAVDDISFAALNATHARLLGLPPGHPGVLVTRSAHDMAGRCLEVRFTRGDAQAFHYSVTII